MKRDEIIRKICKQFIGNYYNISTYRINILKVTIVRKKNLKILISKFYIKIIKICLSTLNKVNNMCFYVFLRFL